MSEFYLPPDATLNGAIMTALGAASTCWEHPDMAGGLYTGKLEEIGQVLGKHIRLLKSRGTSLEMYTTKELLREVELRIGR